MQNFIPFVLLLLLVMPATAQDVVLKVGVYHNPPKIMFDEDDDLSGIHGDLLTVIAERHGWQLIPVECEWDECLRQLESGDIDIMPDVAKTTARNEWMSFHSEHALLSWSQIYADEKEGITSVLDLDEKKVAVLKGSVQEEYLRDIIASFELSTELLPVNSFAEGFDAVKAQKADAVATNQFFGNQQVVSRRLTMTPIMFLPNKLYFAMRSGSEGEVLDAIGREIRQLKANKQSEYYQIIKNWSSKQQPLHIPTYVWWLFGLLALGLGIGLLFNYELRKKVREKTSQLKESKQRLDTILGSVDAYIFIKNTELRYEYVNQRVADLFGREAEEILGKDDYDLFDKTTADELVELDRKVLSTRERSAQAEVNYLPGDKTPHHYWSVKVPLYDSKDDLVGVCGISTDVSEYKQMKEELDSLAYFDPLTGLGNRRFMLDRLRQGLKRYTKEQSDGALILLDIDHFKHLNDRRGHGVGDELLIQFGQRLEKELRQQDDAARLNSDEFMVFLQQPRDGSYVMVEELRDRLTTLLNKLTEPYVLGGEEEQVSVSMGVVLLSDAASEKDILQAVDLALTQAKEASGPHLQFFNVGLQRRFSYQQALLSALRKAITQETLQVYYQPQYERISDSSKITCMGYEALVRWHDDELGWVSPGEFIPLAESEGLMRSIHKLVVKRTLADTPTLQALNPERPIRVAINVSASQFKHSKFVEDMNEQMKIAGVSGSAIELEITESLLIDDIEKTAKTMRQLKDCGITFALDDFGTGYASLGYLKELPLNRLKIDQSFVQDLTQDNSDTAIVETIVALGQSLDMEVIAEGIETEEQLSKLEALGCSQFQGYYFSRPEPLHALTNAEETT